MNILESIKNNRMTTVKFFIIISIIMAIPTILSFFFIKDGVANLCVSIFLVIVLLIIIVKIIVGLVHANNPMNSKIFRKFGSLEKVQQIINSINNDAIYEDKTFILSHKYVVRKTDIESIISFNDVLGIYKRVFKHNNGMPDSYSATIVDKYEDTVIISFDTKEKECEEFLKTISVLCPNAKLGYTKETREYIKDNTVKI